MRYSLAFLTVILLAVSMPILLNPLQRTEGRIREDVLELAPRGTPMDDVILTIEDSTRREISYMDEERGYFTDGRFTVGEKSIEVFMGEHFNFRTLRTPVSAGFAFDGEGRLIDVFVQKDPDIALW